MIYYLNDKIFELAIPDLDNYLIAKFKIVLTISAK